ncbi:hypothetical protein [Cupriavidus sp.]|uniref:hypothetical protein n=1 Tax=Cupriavidus sp. TaxID=1873897 RepID=UPI003D0B2066
MTTKSKPVAPPLRALRDVAAVLARHSAKRVVQGDDAVSAEVARSGPSHLKRRGIDFVALWLYP